MRHLWGFFGLSVFLHTVTFISFDRSHYFNFGEFFEKAKAGAFHAKKNGQGLDIQFVETPAQSAALAPKEAKRISDKDAINRDDNPVEAPPAQSPSAEQQGPTDQLAQQRLSGPQHPGQAAREPSPERQVHQATMSELSTPDLERINSPSEFSEAKPAIAATPVGDKITTQEMSRQKSPGAGVFGTTSFEATGSGMGAYMKNLKEKIWLAWFPYLAFKYPMDPQGADAVISFTLNKKGDVVIVRVVEKYGSDLFADFCMEAVQRAGNFGPVPEDILALVGKDEVEIKFGFHYR